MMREAELGFHQIGKEKNAKLDDAHEKNAREARKELESIMRPELINRFDGILTFRALTRPVVGKIFDSLVSEVRIAAASHGLSL